MAMGGSRIGLAAQACAVGQAAARSWRRPPGSNGRISAPPPRWRRWLAGEGPMPDWPGLATIAPARDFAARHGAMLLGWRAVLDAYAAARG
jgi:hypothetical protein